MKKILMMILCCMMLSSCSYFEKNEKEAVLKVAVHDEMYGQLLNELWKETYPEQELVIEVVKEDEIKKKLQNKEEIDYDVYWIEDAYVGLAMDSLLKVEDNYEVPLNTKFSETFDAIKKVYQPIMATSDMYYALDINKLEKDKISEDVFLSFESMSQYENSFYYLDHVKFTKPFLTSNMDYFPGKEKMTLSFLGDSFKEALQDYREILKLVPCNDPKSYDNWFINDTYYSGYIVNTMQLEADEEINHGKIKISKLPTINGKQIYMEAISYGYVVNAKSEYPKAAKNLLELMHSKKGMQLLCNSEDLIPLINEDLLEKFNFSSDHAYEKAVAMNSAMGRSFIGIKNKKDAAIDFLYLDNTQEKLKTCDLEEIEVCQMELDEEYQEWLE